MKAYQDETFKIKDLGLAHYFLGLEILPHDHGLILTQRKFVKELLQQFGDPDASPVISPLDPTVKLLANEGDLFPDPTLYRQIVGKLNFVTHTRPDLAFTVQHLSQFMQSPHTCHYRAVQHVLRYLKGQPDLGIVLHKEASYGLQAYCDSDRLPVLTQGSLLVAMWSSLARASFPGNPRNKARLHYPQLKQSIEA